MLVNYNGRDLNLPDFLIVGAAKSGTTSLHYYLKQHPDIFMPTKKELYFFSYMDTAESRIPNWIRKEKHGAFNVEDYADCFVAAKEEQVSGEASPLYLYTYRDTIKNIKTVYGEQYRNVKIIIILRNPVERAWSHFIMNKRDGSEQMDEFREASRPEIIKERLENNRDMGFDYIGLGMYNEQVGAFMAEFPQVKVLLYDEFCADALKVVKDIFNFIGVDADFSPNTETIYNMSGESSSKLLDYFVAKKNPIKDFLKFFLPYEFRSGLKFKVFQMILRKKRMPDDIKKDLIERYRDNILNLQSLLKRDLSMWLK